MKGSVQAQRSNDELSLQFSGELVVSTAGELWNIVHRELTNPAQSLRLHLGEVTNLDGAGAALLLNLQMQARQHGGSFMMEGLPERFQPILKQFDIEDFERPAAPARPESSIVAAGRSAVEFWKDITDQITFAGEMIAALAVAATRPWTVRWKDAFRTAETAGANALPIVILIGFLIGLIMAFQAAIPMRQFGADLFVADLVALSMMRELGPLMTAIVLAGRSGSAFAAEIGTMKVNEEVNALMTFGLDPVRFLVTPRVIAAVAMTPLLTIFANIAGLAGGLTVFLSLGFPTVTYMQRVAEALSLSDFLGGIAKAFVFGILVAAVGCMRGLRTKTGASAVGDSTTQSVVSSIVLIALTDGVFSVIYYYLGI